MTMTEHFREKKQKTDGRGATCLPASLFVNPLTLPHVSLSAFLCHPAFPPSLPYVTPASQSPMQPIYPLNHPLNYPVRHSSHKRHLDKAVVGVRAIGDVACGASGPSMIGRVIPAAPPPPLHESRRAHGYGRR